jgi:hypothetical protein
VKPIGVCNSVDQKYPICYNICIVNKKELEMSKKHFVAMAKEISSMPNKAQALATAIAFCKVAAAANPRFDQARFLDACGV